MDDQMYEINIKRFIQSAEYQLTKLNETVIKLKEYQNEEDWQNVKKYNLNASQIIKRIKSEIKEIQKIRGQVVANIETVSSNPVVERIDEKLKEITRKLLKQTQEIESISAPYFRYELKNQNHLIESTYIGPELYNYQVQRDEYISQDKELCRGYDQLQKDCEDLAKIMQIFSNEIYNQKPTIDAIESNISQVQQNISAASNSLKQALTYKTMGSAAAGAVVGTVVGGPLGLVAGAKIGAIVGIGSGIASYLTVKYFNK